MELHEVDLPAPTPEGQLIRRARQVAIPKLSVRVAAGRVGMSASMWGCIERGYYPHRDGMAKKPFSPQAATLARMAHALGISPERLESEGQRPDAAGMLREMLPRDKTSLTQLAACAPAAPDQGGISIRIPPGQVVTIELPGAVSVRIEAAQLAGLLAKLAAEAGG